MPEAPLLLLDHLVALTGRHGLYEHAVYERPRHSHGYTTDDNARASFDGLEAAGLSLDRGAESTFAALGALRSLHGHQRAEVG